MSKISEALVREPRNFSMVQTLSNATNLIGAARSKLSANKTNAAAELDSAAAELIKVIRALIPTYDLGIVAASADPDTAEMLAEIRKLSSIVEARNTEIFELQDKLRAESARADALAVKATAAAVVADEVSPLAAPTPPGAPAPKKSGGKKPKALDVQPVVEEPKVDEQV